MKIMEPHARPCYRLTSPEGVLCVVRHGIRLVQNDQLESRAENGPSAGKTEDLASHDANTSVIGGIELQGQRVGASSGF